MKLLRKIIILSLCVHYLSCNQLRMEGSEIKMGILTYFSPFRPYGPPFTVGQLGAAVPVAVDKINSNSSILGNTTIKVIWQNSGCRNKIALDGLVTLVKDKEVEVVIGPPCGIACEATGLLTSQWNIPQVGFLSKVDSLSDKTIYDTYSRTAAMSDLLGNVIASVTEVYKWDHICIALPRMGGHLEIIKNGVYKHLSQQNVTIPDPFPYNHFETDFQKLLSLMNNISTHCRGMY